MPLDREIDLGPSDIVLDVTQLSPPQKGGQSSPNFWPMFIVAKWLDGSRWHLQDGTWHGGRPWPRPHYVR